MTDEVVVGGPIARRLFPIQRWVIVHQRRLLGAYLLALVSLNAAVFGWLKLSPLPDLEDRIEAAGQARWLPRYEALLRRLAGAAAPERIKACQAFLEAAPEAQLRETLGRARLNVRYLLGAAELEGGSAASAAAIASELVHHDPRDYRLACLQGDARWALGDRELACESYRSALRLQANLPQVVTRLARFELERGDPAATLRTYEAYRDALWVEEGSLALVLPAGVVRGSLKFPVLVDDQPHTYRIYPDASRQASKLAGPTPQGVAGVLLSPVGAKEVSVRLERVRITRAARGPASSGAPLLDDQSFAEWRREPALASQDSSPSLRRTLALPGVEEWGLVSVSQTLGKPYPPELVAAVREACVRLGRDPPASLPPVKKPPVKKP